MKKRKKLATAVVMFAAAAAAAHVMQLAGPPAPAGGGDKALASVLMAPGTPPVLRTATVPTTEPLATAAETAPVVPVALDAPATILVHADLRGVITPVLGGRVSAPEETLAVLDAGDIVTEPQELAAVELPQLPKEGATHKPLPSVPAEVRALPELQAPILAEEPINEYGLSCGPALEAAIRPGAMARLTLSAPCRSGERIVIRHGALVFADRVGNLGSYTVDVPVLYEDAAFEISFSDDETVAAGIDMPQAADAERVVLQFDGQSGLQIHAREFGADYGDAGHIWFGNPRTPTAALRLNGGFLTALGDASLPDPQLAEVYTLPAHMSGRDGVVRLTVEAEVTRQNCGQEVSGQAMQLDDNGILRPVQLTLSIPDCGAVGEFLVLKNLLRDLKIASN